MFDLHMHTTWSDGKNTPEEMIEEAIRLGLETVGISDHSSGDPCGMTLEQSVEYRAEIARLKEKPGTSHTADSRAAAPCGTWPR